MSYLSMFIALLMSTKSPAEVVWLDYYLDNLVRVEQTMLTVSFVILGIAVGLALLLLVLAIIGKSELGFSLSLFTGCAAVFILFLPLMEWLTLTLAQGMASAVSPVGVTDIGKLIVHAIIYVLIGAG